MTEAAPSAAELDRAAELIEGWARRLHRESDLLAAVDREPGGRRWYMRMRGESKAAVTVWLTLRQRSLRAETQVMPAPEENVEACYEYLLRRNAELVGMTFALGPEDGVYLVDRVPVTELDEDRLDRILGSAWEYTEQSFATAMSIGYASRYRRRRGSP